MNMLEKVAAAIKNSGSYSPDWQGGDEDLLIMARAAIVAMFDPTEEVFKAIEAEIASPRQSSWTGVMIWQAGITAALDETPPSDIKAD